MGNRLGSNPLDSLKIKGKEDLSYLEARKIAKIEKKKPEICVHLRKNEDAYFCDSPMSRQHGLLGNREEAGQKCEKCHVKILK